MIVNAKLPYKVVRFQIVVLLQKPRKIWRNRNKGQENLQWLVRNLAGWRNTTRARTAQRGAEVRCSRQGNPCPQPHREQDKQQTDVTLRFHGIVFGIKTPFWAGQKV